MSPLTISAYSMKVISKSTECSHMGESFIIPANLIKENLKTANYTDLVYKEEFNLETIAITAGFSRIISPTAKLRFGTLMDLTLSTLALSKIMCIMAGVC